MRFFLAIILALLYSTILYSQEDLELNQDELLQIEAIQVNTDRSNKLVIDLISPDYETLSSTNILNKLQINQILFHIKEYGPMIEFDELQMISSLDHELLDYLKKYCKLIFKNSSVPFSGLPSLNTSSRFYVKWKRKFDPELKPQILNHTGDNNTLLFRYILNQSDKLQMGILLEKDPGEKLLNSYHPYLTDHLSLYLRIKNPYKKIKNICIGDFQIAYGQGLISSNAFSAGKPRQITRVVKNMEFCRVNNSLDENRYYRGIQASFALSKNWDCDLFISRKKLDAQISEDMDELKKVTSLLSSGLHRTISEIQSRKTLVQNAWGSRLSFRSSDINLNLNMLGRNYSYPFHESDEFFKAHWNIHQSQLHMGVDYQYTIYNNLIFGELAFYNESISQLHGLIINPSPYLSCAFILRSFGLSYFSNSAQAFGESSNANNELGYFFLLEWRVLKNIKVKVLADSWKNFWPKSQTIDLWNFKEFQVGLEFNKRKKWKILIDINYESGPASVVRTNSRISDNIQLLNSRIRLHSEYSMSPALIFRSRMELRKFKEDELHKLGLLIYQDIIYRKLEFPLSAVMRFAIFDTPDFDTRIYAYENGLVREFSIPAYFGKGSRHYLILRYNKQKYSLEFSYSKTFKKNTESFIWGIPKTQHNSESELKTQLILKF